MEISRAGMAKQYEHLSKSVAAAAAVAIKHGKKKQTYNGREMSDRTKRLHDLRTRDFSSDRQITKDDRSKWNKVINESCKNDE